MKNKIQKSFLTILMFVGLSSQIGCGGISPGDGPAFSESMTAQDLFYGASQNLYLPDSGPVEKYKADRFV